MNWRQIIALLLLTTLKLSVAHAVARSSDPVSQPAKGYDCEVTIIADTLPNGAVSQKFKRPVLAEGTHGGEPLELKFEGGYRVAILADGRWRSLSWWHDDQLIGEVVSVYAAEFAGQHVMIIYNPANRDEQAFLSCSPE